MSPSRSTYLRAYLWYGALAFFTGVVCMATTFFVRNASASQLVNISDTLSTSKPGMAAEHTIRFTTPSGIPADGSTIVITVPNGFDMSTIGEDDVDIADDGGELTTSNVCGAVHARVSTSTQTITIELCSGGGGAIAASSIVVIKVGTNAVSSGTGTHNIVNHASPGSYELEVAGTMVDIGYTRLVIVDAVTISGSVDTYLDFSIAGVDGGEGVNAEPTLTTGTTTATSVPFGTIQPATPYVLAQDLSVTTNASNGFTVTVEADGDLRSGSGATINSFVDGSGTSTPVVWSAPAAQAGVSATYGHWGLTTEDITLSGNDSFGSALYAGDFVNDPREVMYATSSADGTTPHIGATRIGYKLEISMMQEAARDYATRLMYVVTPVF